MAYFLMAAMRRSLLLPLLVWPLASCGGPSESQIETDFRTLKPGCDLLSSAPGEGDSDNVYMVFSYSCGAAPQAQFEALYQRNKGQWILNREVSQRGIDE